MLRPTLLALFLVGSAASAQDRYENRIAKASGDGEKAIKRFQLAPGVQAKLWAAEPMLANPVAFCFDDQGRCYVAETFRMYFGVTDNRRHKWTDDDLASKTVADRVALYQKHDGYKFSWYSGDTDRIRQLVDTKGAGVADRATVFSDGYINAEDGLGSGVLAWRGNVYYACIPDLWLLKDTKDIGVADVKKSLHKGYGVHVAFVGHDLHGLRMGPDGKVYFSIGDRGLNVEADGKKFVELAKGSVLRCNPDGSQLEIVHTGLRNPQELAFDEYGNLFTCDNNADGGDQARWVQIVEGGDTGWRLGFQYLPKLGIWNSEKMWMPKHEGQPAAHLPTLGNFSSGPSGLTYHPGVTLLPEKYQKNFFLCDFRGSFGGSGVYAIRLKPKGASFEIDKTEKLIWSILATDCDFAPDGGLYVSDWSNGWSLSSRGRIYKLFEESKAGEIEAKSVQKLLGEGFSHRPATSLIGLLSHADMRVRQEAQFALVDKQAVVDLQTLAVQGTHQLARIHAMWGLGQLARKQPGVVKILVPLTADKDAEIRAQAAKVLGESKFAAEKELADLLSDESLRVRFHACLALAKVGTNQSLPQVLAMLSANNDVDPYLRHAGVMYLVHLNNHFLLDAVAKNPDAAVRLAAVLAMRRLEMPSVAMLLGDAEPKVAMESARAIYDQPIPRAFAALAKAPLFAAAEPYRTSIQRRVLAVHLRLGQKENAAALTSIASNQALSEAIRLEALQFLQAWPKPTGKDPIVGLWRPREGRSADDVAEAIRASLSALTLNSDKVRAEVAKLAAQYGIKEIGPTLRTLLQDPTKSTRVRIEALRALEVLRDKNLGDLAKALLTDEAPLVRHESRRIFLAKLPPQEVVTALAEVFKSGEIAEKQGALALLANVKDAGADVLLAQMLATYAKLPAEIRLDVLEAAEKRTADPVKKALAALAPAAKDELAAYLPSMSGGEAELGKNLYFDRAELSCVRCHKIQGVGGDVGPDLFGLSKRVKRDYILESIAVPNKHIAKGFETLVLLLNDGKVVTGILKGEDAKEVRLVTAEGKILIIAKDEIDTRSSGPSAMPADLIRKMSRRELRDLVEFLSGL